MNGIRRLFWVSYAGFLLSFLFGIFNFDNDAGAVSLAIMLACAATFLACTAAISNWEGDESRGEHYARCLHCASWLNQRISEHISASDEASARARQIISRISAEGAERATLLLPSAANDQTQALAKLDELRRSFPGLLKSFEEEKRSIEEVLTQLLEHRGNGTKLLADAEAAVTISRAGFNKTGRWRTGAEVAGEFILADRIEPQQTTAILCRPLRTSVSQSSEAHKVLKEALASGEQQFKQLSLRLAG